MPYIIPPGTTLPPPPTVVHSSDGLLTATLDAEYAGVQLFADFSERVIATNWFTDPSWEHGAGDQIDGTPTSTGSGICNLDTAHKHSGTRSVKITNTTRTVDLTNLVTNPNAAGAGTHWSKTDTSDYSFSYGSGYAEAAFTSTMPSSRGLAYNLNNTDSSLLTGPGALRSVSAEVWTNTSRELRLCLNFIDSTGAVIAPTYIQTTAITANTWTTMKLNVATVAPANTAYVYLRVLGNASWVAGDVLRVRTMTVVASATAADPFSGDTPATGDYQYRWSGAANASPSERTLPGTSNSTFKNTTTAWTPTPAEMGLANGDMITVSAWCYIPSSSTVDSNAHVFFLSGAASLGTAGAVMRDSDGNVIDGDPFNPPRDRWFQYCLTGPVDNADAEVNIRLYTGQAYGDVIYWDDIGIAPGTEPLSFNGDTPADGGLQYRWTGEPGESSSQEYYPGSEALPASVKFYREDGTLVRSGDAAPAVGGEALAYDHEVPLGTYSAWYAVALDADGNVLQTSATVQLFVPAPSNRTSVWIKSVTNPSLSLQVRAVNDIPGMSLAARQQASDVLGSPFPVVSLDSWSASTSDWQFWVESAAERKALEACLTSGVVLVQPHPSVDFDDMFAVAGDVSREYAGSTIQQDQLVSLTFTEVARPAVEGAPLLTPGRTWQWLKDHQETWATVRDSYDSWLDVAGLPVS